MLDPTQKEKKASNSFDKIANMIQEVCDSENISEEQILTNVLERFGFKKPKLERQVPLKLTEDIKKKLNEKIKEIAEKIAAENHSKVKRRKIGPNIMDRSLAQYIIEYTLLNYDCMIDGRKARKKDVDAFMGFSERTMREQQKKYKLTIKKSHTLENKIYTELLKQIDTLR